MLRRFYVFLMAALILALGISPVLAQEGPTFGLSPEDLALLMGMSEAMKNVNSAAFTFDINLSFNDPSGGESGEMSITGDGAWMKGEEFGEYAVRVSGVASLPDGTSVGFESVMIGQDIYVRSQNPETGEWSDWETLTDMTMMQQAGAPQEGAVPMVPFNPEDMPSPEEMQALEEEFSALSSELDLESIFTIQRGDDIAVDGQTVAVFNYDVNLMSLFSDPALPPLFSRIMELSGTDAAAMEEEAGMTPEQMLMMLGFIFADTTISGQVGVGVDDNYMYLFSLSLAGSLDLGSMMGGMGGGGAAQAGPVTFGVDFTVQYSDFNAQFDIQPPI